VREREEEREGTGRESNNRGGEETEREGKQTKY